MGILQDLEFRGLINQQTDAEGLEQLLEKKALNYTVVSTRQRIATHWSYVTSINVTSFPISWSPTNRTCWRWYWYDR